MYRSIRKIIQTFCCVLFQFGPDIIGKKKYKKETKNKIYIYIYNEIQK